jgi:hypothetical protein
VYRERAPAGSRGQANPHARAQFVMMQVGDEHADGSAHQRPSKHIGREVLTRVDREIEAPFPPEASNLDLVVINLVYHDTVWLGIDRGKMNRAVFAALKPGGSMPSSTTAPVLERVLLTSKLSIGSMRKRFAARSRARGSCSRASPSFFAIRPTLAIGTTLPRRPESAGEPVIDSHCCSQDREWVWDPWFGTSGAFR